MASNRKSAGVRVEYAQMTKAEVIDELVEALNRAARAEFQVNWLREQLRQLRRPVAAAAELLDARGCPDAAALLRHSVTTIDRILSPPPAIANAAEED